MPARALLDDRDLMTLPRSQWNRVQRLRGELLDHLADAANDLGAGLDGDVERAIATIKRSKYNSRVIRREVRRLVRSHYGALGEALAGQIEHAASMGQRYSEVMDAFAVTGGKGAPISGSAMERLLREGRATARQALATEVLLSQPAATPVKESVADRIMRREIKPWRAVRVPSSRLHGRAVKATREINTQIMAAVRESKQLTASATDLIRAVRKTGAGEVGGNAKLSKLMGRVQDAGQALNRRGGPEALEEWRVVRKQLHHYMRRLAEGGRTRSSMLELLQHTSDTSAKGIDRAIRQHAAFKQKYAAERLIKSETMASYKAEQIFADQKHNFIVGYIWRMNRAARSGFVRRRTSKSGRIIGGKRYRRGGRRRRCVCEELDGKRLSLEMVRGRSARLIAHPH